MPMQVLNELRRTALERLEDEILCAYRRVEKERIARAKSVERTENLTAMYVKYTAGKHRFKIIKGNCYYNT